MYKAHWLFSEIPRFILLWHAFDVSCVCSCVGKLGITCLASTPAYFFRKPLAAWMMRSGCVTCERGQSAGGFHYMRCCAVAVVGW